MTADITADTDPSVRDLDAATPIDDRRGGSILVGIDGSGCALQAARWAADEASRRHMRLVLVHVYWLHSAGYPGDNPYPARELDDLRESGTTALRDAMSTLRRDHPSLTVTSRLEYGNPIEVLSERSSNAVLTVIGSHDSSGPGSAIGATLTLWIIEAISIAVDQWFGAHADATSRVASQAMAPCLAADALVGIVPLIAYLRRIQGGPVGSRETPLRPASTGASAA